MSAVKKSKLYHFNNDWEEEFFFTMNNDKCLCLICNVIISLPKRGNLNRHYSTVHEHYNRDYPLNSKIRKEHVQKLKTTLYSQQSFFKKVCNKSTSATVASLRVTHILAKHKKPFTDGEIFKEGFLAAGDSLFENFKNKDEIMKAIQSMQLSRNAVARRFELLANDMRLQLQNDFEACTHFSLQFDESLDVCDTAQLSIFARLTFSDCSMKEEQVKIIPIKGTCKGEDIYNSFKDFIKSEELPLQKLVSITTDGAPSMVGSENGFIALCMKDENFPKFLSYHCIIHQQALCAKFISLDQVMKTAIKIINSIRSKPLQRRKFKLLLEEFEKHHSDLLLHNEIRWLSKGLVLARFRELLPEIKLFLLERNDDRSSYLQNKKWLLKLAFLTDLTSKLNEINLELQGRSKTIIDMISSVNSFKMKLKLWISKLKKKDFSYFSHLKDEIGENVDIYDYEEYAVVLRRISEEFDNRFADFKNLNTICSFISSPLDINENLIEGLAKDIAILFSMDSSDVELQLIELTNDVTLVNFKTDVWKVLNPIKYSYLIDVYLRVSSCFGSTYLCEASFAHMNYIKSKYRSRLTDNHLDDCMRFASSNYRPNYLEIGKNEQCQISH